MPPDRLTLTLNYLDLDAARVEEEMRRYGLAFTGASLVTGAYRRMHWENRGLRLASPRIRLPRRGIVLRANGEEA